MSQLSTVEILRAAREKIADPARWRKGWYASDVNGVDCYGHDPEACRWCAIGAIQAVVGDPDTDQAPSRALRSAAGVGAHYFNDKPSTTHSDVLSLFDRAIAAQENTQHG